MANSISLASKYQALTEETFKYNATSSVLDTPAERVRFIGGQAILVGKISTDGLADGSRSSSIVSGDVTFTWDTLTMSKHRSRSFSVHQFDNEESMDQSFGQVMGYFLKNKSVPEVDAYRYETLATAAIANSKSAEATLSDSSTEAAVKAGIVSLMESEALQSGGYLFITPTVWHYLLSDTGTKFFATNTGNQYYDDQFMRYENLKIVLVPQTRFYATVTYLDGVTTEGGDQTAGGYADGGKDINFIIVDPASVIQVVKHEIPRFFAPNSEMNRIYGADGVNQDGNFWKFDYEIYHDLFVLDNTVDGVYAHTKAS